MISILVENEGENASDLNESEKGIGGERERRRERERGSERPLFFLFHLQVKMERLSHREKERRE